MKTIPIVPIAATAGELQSKAIGSNTEGVSCSNDRSSLKDAARGAGKREVLGRLEADYPLGPHDQPQSMCPAFGSLRVGLRMRRTATVLSGSACCVYGLTFTSHFYGARRSVGYVPFDSETLVTGKLFEDIRESVHKLADPEQYDAVVIINLCVPTASGVPLELLPKNINGVRIIGIDVPGFGVPTHAEAKDVLAGAMLAYARQEVLNGPVQAPEVAPDRDKPTLAMLGEMFPADPFGIAALLEPLGIEAGPVVPTREWRELYRALDCRAAAAIHPHYTACTREFERAGRAVIGSAPVGYHGTRAWLTNVARVYDIDDARLQAALDSCLPPIRAALDQNPVSGRITISGYEGSELLVARLLIESGAQVPYVGTACPATESSAPDRQWLEAHGTRVQFRASLEQDQQAVEQYEPDLAIGTTPVVQFAKERCVPALYFTNLISARPLMGAAGPGSLAAVVNASMANKPRFEAMSELFGQAGQEHAAGIWQRTPEDDAAFRASYARQLAKLKQSRAVEEGI